MIDHVPELIRTPVKQQEWFKQYLEDNHTFIRTIDRLSTAEIADLYERGMFACDKCGKELQINRLNRDDMKIHVLHVINKAILLCCEDCDFEDFDKVIVAPKELLEWYQEEKERRNV